MPAELALIYDALHLLGWQLDWSGLPVVMALIGLSDLETTVRLMRLVIDKESELSMAKQ